MEWLRLVGSLKLQVSFAKEPCKRHNILQKRPIISRSLLIIATSYDIWGVHHVSTSLIQLYVSYLYTYGDVYTHMVHVHITYGVCTISHMGYTMCLQDIYHVCIHMICMCHVYTHMVMVSCKNVDVWCLCPVDVSCREYGVFVMQMVHTHMVMVHTPYVYSTCMQHTFT